MTRHRNCRIHVLLVVVLASVAGFACKAKSSEPVAGSGNAGRSLSGLRPAAVGVSDVVLAKRFGAAVWRVETNGCGFTRSGSAFAVDAHHLVTNNHVISNDSAPIVRSPTGQALHGRVIGTSNTPDIAVIEVTEKLPLVVGWARTASLAIGEHVVLFGYPLPARRFTVSPGSIVSFQPPGARQAILANTAIEHGNSGGPALLSDGTTAGVGTQMTLPHDPAKRVAIIFTTNTVRATVDQFLQHPAAEVLSDCGIGPDYVPPLPPGYSVQTVPPTTPSLPTVPPPTVPESTPEPPDAPIWDVPPAPPSSSVPTSTTTPSTSTSSTPTSSTSTSSSSTTSTSTSTTTQPAP
ncbi:MAG TPA: serine protease [Acidimicrobiales bacterium]